MRNSYRRKILPERELHLSTITPKMINIIYHDYIINHWGYDGIFWRSIGRTISKFPPIRINEFQEVEEVKVHTGSYWQFRIPKHNDLEIRRDQKKKDAFVNELQIRMLEKITRKKRQELNEILGINHS